MFRPRTAEPTVRRAPSLAFVTAASILAAPPLLAQTPDGDLIHDDYILADALVARLDQLEWTLRSQTVVIQARDPLDDMSHF